MVNNLMTKRSQAFVLDLIKKMRGNGHLSAWAASAATVSEKVASAANVAGAVNEQVAGRKDNDSSSDIGSFDGMSDDFGDEESDSL